MNIIILDCIIGTINRTNNCASPSVPNLSRAFEHCFDKGSRVAPLRMAILALVVVMITLCSAIPAAAQSCDPSTSLMKGTIETGDGSYDDPVFWGYESVGGLPYGPTGGTHSLGEVAQPQTAPGDYEFTAGTGAYYPSPWVYGSKCTQDPVTSCITCTGTFHITIYSTRGNFYGTVAEFPSGSPVPRVGVSATSDCWGCSHSTVTDDKGNYTFKAPGATNNWGVFLKDKTVPRSTAGSATYDLQVTAFGNTYHQTEAISSNQNKRVDFALWNDSPRPDIRCCRRPTRPQKKSAKPASKRPPACPGKPVSCTTGNAYFDQTDAVLEGLGPNVSFVRSYNSINRYRAGIFGPGWSHSFEVHLVPPAGSSTVIQLWEADGVPVYFEDNDQDGRYEPSVPYDRESWIIQQASGFTHYFREGGREEFDGSGNLMQIVDASGNAVTLSYTAGQLTTIRGAGGRVLTLGYDGIQLKTLSGPAGLIATYGYDTSGRLHSVQYADDAASGYTFDYDSQFNAITVISDLSGRPVETHAYDNGLAMTSELASGQERYSFQYLTNQSIVTDALGNTTTYDYEMIWGQRLVTKITGPCLPCDSNAPVQQWAYDQRGRVTSYTDALGNTTTYAYDLDTGDLLSETDPMGHVTSYTYDGQGRVLTQTNPDGGVIHIDPGPAGPLSITDPINRQTIFNYNTLGELMKITDPRGKLWTFDYNTFGDMMWSADPLEQTDPGRHKTTYEYDEVGRRTRSIDPLSNPSPARSYNVRGQVTHITNPDPTSTHTDFIYDGGGRLLSVTDALRRPPTTYTYGGVGRLREVKDSMGGITKYIYDVMSHLVQLIDAKGQTTSFGYDPFGRIIWTIYPNGAQEVFTYDSAGRLKTKRDRRMVVTTYSYDNDDRLTGKTYSDGTPPVSYGYDATTNMIHRLTSAANGTDTLMWSYDLAGQLLSEGTQFNGSTVAYGYDPDGNQTSVSLVNTQYQVGYGYDDASQLMSITRGTDNVINLSYDNANRRQTLRYPNNVITNYGYDNLSRLTNLATALGTTSITNFVYAYNPVNDRTSKTTPSVAETYGYDDLSRLKEVKRSGTTTESYTYDAVGNRLTSLTDPNWNYPLNNNNELLSNSSAAFTYDADGNLTQKVEGGNTWKYEWNAENQLLRVLKNSGEVMHFAYDPLGRRVAKVNPGATRTFTYDGEDILRKVISFDNPAQAQQRFRYVHGPGIDEPLELEDVLAGSYSYFHADALGSIVKMTDGAGAVTTSQDYDAFGNGATIGDHTFTGREYDAVTGLYYYRARYYDPKIGRFISEDPIGFGGGINFYAYVGNDPVSTADPFGLQAKSPTPKVRPTPRPTPSPTPHPSVPSNAAFYVCCTGGKMGVCDGPAAPPNTAAYYSVRKCMQRHEQCHIDDLNSNRFFSDKQVCGAALEHLPIQTNNGPQAECSAYCAELKCLEGEPWSQLVENSKKEVNVEIILNCGPVGCLP